MNQSANLSSELVDQIIFGMENQEHTYFLDLDKLEIISDSELDQNVEDGEGSGDLVPIPGWESVDGYNLMEGFVAALKNPLAREQLRRILQSGRGVFRQFKNALKEQPEVEKLWFAYKDREMKRHVLEWFNTIRESRGLEALKAEIPETEDLVLSDFEIHEMEDPRELQDASDLDRAMFSLVFADPREAAYWYSFRRDHLPPIDSPDEGCIVLGVYNPGGELCGFLWALHDEVSPRKVIAHILQLYVDPAYRGLGIAATLLEHYLQNSRSEDIRQVHFENWAGVGFLGPMLERQGFREFSRIFSAFPDPA